MMQRWGTDAVRFMRDASEYGNFYAELTQELLPYIPQDGHICDAGCGLGYLAQALSRYCKKMTAIDISCAATDALKARATAENLSVRCEDIFALEEAFDAVIFCYFGKTDEILSLSKKLCRGNVIVIKRDCAEHTFSLGAVQRKRHSVENLSQVLDERKVPYIQKQICLEMGQPFRNFDDAMRFFELYNKSEQAVTEELVRNRIRATNDPDFPLYLPSTRKMELIVFSAHDI